MESDLNRHRDEHVLDAVMMAPFRCARECYDTNWPGLVKLVYVALVAVPLVSWGLVVSVIGTAVMVLAWLVLPKEKYEEKFKYDEPQYGEPSYE